MEEFVLTLFLSSLILSRGGTDGEKEASFLATAQQAESVRVKTEDYEEVRNCEMTN